jgi:hypothetical protein
MLVDDELNIMSFEKYLQLCNVPRYVNTKKKMHLTYRGCLKFSPA